MFIDNQIFKEKLNKKKKWKILAFLGRRKNSGIRVVKVKGVSFWESGFLNNS